ncbi:hypothetical protein G4O51_02850 [Candidatus Bathyarchaeota archaeon A05DMB-2]|jgi:hypothetical protein|nr:hypothetical protein [Candidatus Bathyarchaeota archaeon A05DMB-2]
MGSSIVSLTLNSKKRKLLEVTFAAVFSALILVLFYAVISMNGLVLGNDPAVHLEKAQIFLETGKIPLENLGWTPPLFQILLAMLISFTGANSFTQLILLEKTLAVLIDWLLFFSVYLLGSRFFGMKIGGIAAVLLLFCVPMYELNLWGGYTTVLGLAFLFLLLLYLPLAATNLGYVVVAFFAAFSLVLSHQLTTFLTVLILPPIILYMLIKSRGTHLKALIAVIIGGGIAFFFYYFKAMLPYLGVLIEHVFLTQKATLYQVPATTLSAFMINFGFMFIVALAGVFLAFFDLRAKKEPLLFLILFLSFLVPLILAESHLFGLYLPFQWFIYYLTPPLVILAAVTLSFAGDQVSAFYLKHRKSWKKLRLRAVTVTVIALVCLLFVFRFGTVYGKIMEGSVYYSTSDLKAYDAGVWLSTHYPSDTTVVVTDIPGFWFTMFSGKNVIAATDPVIQRNQIAESVLDLSYEMEHPLTLVKAYEAKGTISDENYVSINDVWKRVSHSAADGDTVSYQKNGVAYNELKLSTFSREITFEDDGMPKKMVISYSNGEVAVSQTLLMHNDSYPLSVTWTVAALRGDITNVSLYVSTFFDLQFSFLKAYVPGALNWENPWSNPSNSQGNEWAVVNFTRSTLKDNYVGFYDDKNSVVFGLKFEELPDWGNVGALANMQIDAVRFQYDFDKISANQTVSFSYQILTFSKNSYSVMQQPSELKSVFDAKPAITFEVSSRDYHDYINANDIKFIVYDKNQLDTKIVNCKLLELIYANDRYVIFRIKATS